MGDVKLAFLMGAASAEALPALMLAMLLAVIPAIWLLVRHGRARYGYPVRAVPRARLGRHALRRVVTSPVRVTLCGGQPPIRVS